MIKESLEKSQGKKLDEVSSELLKHHLFKAMAAIKDGDPVKFYDLVISEGRLGVEKEKVELQKQKLATEKERLDILREQVGDHGECVASGDTKVLARGMIIVMILLQTGALSLGLMAGPWFAAAASLKRKSALLNKPIRERP